KTISRPKPCCSTEPSGPCRPKSMSNTRPVATGGTNNGSITSVSTTAFPGQSRRGVNQATAIPSGKINNVLKAETSIVKKKICHASAVTALRLLRYDKSVFREDCSRLPASELIRRFFVALTFLGGFQ